MAFSSNGGDGTLTVVREEAPDRFGVVATIPTKQGARTMTLDPKTHRIYLSAATPAPAPAAKAETKTAPAAKGKGGGRGRQHGAGVIRRPRRGRLTSAFGSTAEAAGYRRVAAAVKGPEPPRPACRPAAVAGRCP